MLATRSAADVSGVACDVHGSMDGNRGAHDAMSSLPELLAGNFVVKNGDILDRGRSQVLVLFMEMALKVLFPEQYWIVRGNPEVSS
jgi:hypothetical protein